MKPSDPIEVLLWGLYSLFLPVATFLAARKSSKAWNGSARTLDVAAARAEGYRASPERVAQWLPSSNVRAFFSGIHWLPWAVLPISAIFAYEVASGNIGMARGANGPRQVSSLWTLADVLLSYTSIAATFSATLSCWMARARFKTELERLPAAARLTAATSCFCGASLMIGGCLWLVEDGLELSRYSSDAALLELLGGASIALGFAGRRVAKEVEAAYDRCERPARVS